MGEVLVVAIAVVVAVALLAALVVAGTTGTAPSGTVDDADSSTRDGTGMIAFDRGAPTQSWEVSTGRAVSRGELTVSHAAVDARPAPVGRGPAPRLDRPPTPRPGWSQAPAPAPPGGTRGGVV